MLPVVVVLERREMEIAEIKGAFPWGLLVVCDDLDPEEIPPWETDETAVTASGTSLLCRVLHGQFGDVEVHVWDAESQLAGYEVFSGNLRIDSGVLIVGDVPRDLFVGVSLRSGVFAVRVFTNEASLESDRVDIQISGPLVLQP